MTNPNSDRLDKIEILLESFITASIADRQASNERMTRLEQSTAASDKRLTRIEQIVESNNKFLESFSTDLRRYTDSMNNLATSIDGVIATSNQDRQETNSRRSENTDAVKRDRSAFRTEMSV